MCFDTDSEPPIPRIAGAAVSHDELSSRGRRQPVRRVPRDARRAGHDGDRHPARTFAASTASTKSSRCGSPSAAYAALAFDYFGRTAGAEKRDDDFEYMPHVEQTTDDGVQADARGAVAHCASSARRRCSPSASASAAGLRGSPPRRATGSPARSASTARRRASAAGRAPSRAPRDRVPDPRAAGRRRPNITAEDNAAFDEALNAPGRARDRRRTTARRTASSTASRQTSPRRRTMPGSRTLAFIAAHS